jgi:hypothetical protein
VQIVARPWREDIALAVACRLELSAAIGRLRSGAAEMQTFGENGRAYLGDRSLTFAWVAWSLLNC